MSNIILKPEEIKRRQAAFIEEAAPIYKRLELLINELPVKYLKTENGMRAIIEWTEEITALQNMIDSIGKKHEVSFSTNPIKEEYNRLIEKMNKERRDYKFITYM